MSEGGVVNPRGFVVDIDDTLADTAWHCALKIAAEYPETLLGSDARTLIAKHLQPGQVPNWENSEIQERITEHLNSPDFLGSVPTVVDSVEILGKMHDQVAPVSFYLTSRVHKHRDVTVRWLQEHTFPEAPIMMRAEHETRIDWKMVFLERFYPTTYGLIEDNCAMVLQSEIAYPGKIFLFDQYDHYGSDDEKGQIRIAHSWKQLGQLVGV